MLTTEINCSAFLQANLPLDIISTRHSFLLHATDLPQTCHSHRTSHEATGHQTCIVHSPNELLLPSPINGDLIDVKTRLHVVIKTDHKFCLWQKSSGNNEKTEGCLEGPPIWDGSSRPWTLAAWTYLTKQNTSKHNGNRSQLIGIDTFLKDYWIERERKATGEEKNKQKN
jgi:hypothetical protein